MTKKKKSTSEVKSIYMPLWMINAIDMLAEKNDRKFSDVARRLIASHPEIKKLKKGA